MTPTPHQPDRPSIPDYVAACDEDQLENLIERAKARLKQIRESEWVTLWVVSDDWINHAWADSYAKAVEHLANIATEHAANGVDDELHLTKKRYPAEEAAELLKRTIK